MGKVVRVYIASSWRNPVYPVLRDALSRESCIEVHDWRDPQAHFTWAQIGIDGLDQGRLVDVRTYREGLSHDAADLGFARDMQGLLSADCCVLLMPSGRSAHIEAGYAAGRGKSLAVFVPDAVEPDLMHKMAELITDSYAELLSWLQEKAA